jgi:hypothetical protein
VLGLTVSTDRLLQYLGSRLRPARPPSPEPGALSDAAQPEPAGPTVPPDIRRTWLGSWTIATAFGAIGLAQALWLWPLLADAASADRVVERLRGLGEDDLPDRLGGTPRVGFENVERDTQSAFGNYSKYWRYASPRGTAVVAVDYPFRGWHELSQCYRGIGWDLRERVVRRGEAGPLVEATFEHPDGRPATLFFGLDDLDGAALEANPYGSTLAYLRNRLAILNGPPGELARRLAGRYVAMPRAYQVQLLCVGDQPLTVEERAEARRLFDTVRARVREAVATGARTGSAWRPS